MRISLEETLEKTNIMVIDGSMSTALEALGCDLNDSLWTAKILAEQPDLVRQVHLGYFRAGADCGITASYQATIPGLTARGYSRQEAEDCIARSVELFREARALYEKETARTVPVTLTAAFRAGEPGWNGRAKAYRCCMSGRRTVGGSSRAGAAEL